MSLPAPADGRPVPPADARPSLAPDEVARAVRAATWSVYAVFAANGVLISTLLARLPAVRDDLGLSPQQLGLLLLAGSVGSLLALPTAGALVQKLGVRPVVLAGAVLATTGVAFVGVAPDRTFLAAGLFVWGFANGAWDVAMNVEAADVERRLGVTIMPRFHGLWSVGTVVGAGIAAGVAFLTIGRGPHLVVMAGVVLVLAVLSVRSFLPAALGSRGAAAEHAETEAARVAAGGERARTYSLLDAWREPRTLLVGLTMLGFALAEGIAGDWLAIAVVDSRDAAEYVGVAMYWVFLVSVMVGRFVGPVVLDRYGRYRPLLVMAGMVVAGVLTVVLVPGVVGAAIGALLWGIGASLGFPVGMTAAADDPVRAAVRVSVVASIAYTAFLAGPPLVGLLGERFGTDLALLTAVGAALLAAACAVGMRPVPPSLGGASDGAGAPGDPGLDVAAGEPAVRG
ncbi:MFS transporter [Aquipuribacter nitratireducens]|uniref:MFS transporter n=1 Tax=Aquipuribacter nitratireducens TaxID=650104 RepID=A0ABW0GIK4_9MICO